MLYKNKKNRQIELKIEALTLKGNGIGVLCENENSAYSVEVPFAIPGDTVKATLFQKNKKNYKAFLDEVLISAANRIPVVCKHFGQCGGCRWQQIPYEQQLQQKMTQVKQCFSTLLDQNFILYPILPCLSPWQYRNKMEFSFSNDAAGEKFLGLMLDSSRGKVFNLTECHLVNSWFADGVKAVRQWWMTTSLEAFHPFRNTGSLRYLTFREGQHTGDRLVILTVSGNPAYSLKKSDLDSLLATLKEVIIPSRADAQLSIFLRIQQTAKGMPTNFYEMHLYGPDYLRENLQIASSDSSPISFNFKVSPTAFFQPNTKQAEQLYSQALKLLQLSKEDLVYDLYCGTGTLGICAARFVSRVIGIELAPEAALDAQHNVKANGLTNVEILCGSVADILHSLRSSHSSSCIAMVDPPRVGLESKAIQELLQLKPKKILYISCNPMSQAADIAELVAAGYRLICLQPVDQFPHTVHIENIAILEYAL